MLLATVWASGGDEVRKDEDGEGPEAIRLLLRQIILVQRSVGTMEIIQLRYSASVAEDGCAEHEARTAKTAVAAGT